MNGVLLADAATGSGRDVASDDSDLLKALHDEHAGALWSYVVGLTNGDRAQAQDVVQETMLRAWRNPQILSQQSGSARGWLFTVAKRIVIDDWRTARSRRERVTEHLPERPVADTRRPHGRPPDRAGRDADAVGRASRRPARVLLPRLVDRRGGPGAGYPGRAR